MSACVCAHKRVFSYSCLWGVSVFDSVLTTCGSVPNSAHYVPLKALCPVSRSLWMSPGQLTRIQVRLGLHQCEQHHHRDWCSCNDNPNVVLGCDMEHLDQRPQSPPALLDIEDYFWSAGCQVRPVRSGWLGWSGLFFFFCVLSFFFELFPVSRQNCPTPSGPPHASPTKWVALHPSCKPNQAVPLARPVRSEGDHANCGQHASLSAFPSDL